MHWRACERETASEAVSQAGRVAVHTSAIDDLADRARGVGKPQEARLRASSPRRSNGVHSITALLRFARSREIREVPPPGTAHPPRPGCSWHPLSSCSTVDSGEHSIRSRIRLEAIRAMPRADALADPAPAAWRRQFLFVD